MVHYLLYFVAIFSLSQASNLIRWSEAPPDLIGFWRLFIAALILLPAALNQHEFRKKIFSKPRNLLYILITAAFFYAHLWTYFYSAQNTRIANCMILFATNPLFISLGAIFFFKEKFSVRLIIGYLFAALGIFFLVHEKLQFNSQMSKGDLSALVSSVLFSGYILTGKKVRQDISNISFSCALYATTGLLFFVAASIKGVPLTGYPTKSWIGIGCMVVFPTLLGHALFSYLYSKMKISIMSCGKLFEPILSAIVAYFCFAESIGTNTLLAFVAIGCSVLVLFFHSPSED